MTVVCGVDPGLSIEEVAQRAYLAGLIDGDGYICIKRRMPTPANHLSAPKYSVSIGINMTDRAPLCVLARIADKSEESIRSRTRGANKTIYHLDLENNDAISVLKKIAPFLVAKRARMEVALRLAALRVVSRRHRTKVVSTQIFARGLRSAGRPYRVLGLSDAFVEECDALYHQSRADQTRISGFTR